MKRRLVSSLLLPGLLFFAGVSLSCESLTLAGGSPEAVTAASRSAEATATETYAAVNTPFATIAPEGIYLGDAVQHGGYVLTALSVADPAPPRADDQPAAGNKFVSVEVILGNISGNTLGVNVMCAYLEDGDGAVYMAELSGVENQLPLVDLDPGEQTRGNVGFEIPEGAVPARFVYSINVYSNNLLQADLAHPPPGHMPVTVPISPNIPSSRVGDVVEQYGYSITVTNVEDPSQAEAYHPIQEGYKWSACEVILENVSGEEPLSVHLLSALLVDAGGFVYAAAFEGRDGQMDFLELEMGEKAQGWFSFYLPVEASPLYLKYRTDLRAGKYLIAGLK